MSLLETAYTDSWYFHKISRIRFSKQVSMMLPIADMLRLFQFDFFFKLVHLKTSLRLLSAR